MKPVHWRVLKDGFLAGVALYLTVAVFFAVVNIFVGRSPLHTAHVLGEALLGGTPDPLDPAPSGPAVAAFNGVHLVGSLVLGIAAAMLVGAIERARDAWYVFFFIFVAGSIVMILGLGILVAELSHVLAWHSVATGHLAGAAVTTAVLWWLNAMRPDPEGDVPNR